MPMTYGALIRDRKIGWISVVETSKQLHPWENGKYSLVIRVNIARGRSTIIISKHLGRLQELKGPFLEVSM